MKPILAFIASFLFLVNFGKAQDNHAQNGQARNGQDHNGQTQDFESFKIRNNIDLGVPIEPFSTFGYGLNKKTSNSYLDFQVEEFDLVKKPKFYSKDPTQRIIVYSENPMPQMNFSLLAVPLPDINSKMPLQKLDYSENPTLLIKPLY
ncbi:hypothetical protein SAMN04488519_101363 [Algoriphagus ornithinivorans]|uniref:Uncharacterized protein n=1 Tax=Algoriphagus ornithinivorans TaxID=226506 RepID=A0A1I5B2L3_9BACT|nr:hypothetical protein [Algoriphagus ornithinivorans]SFN68968.1 hypothetical protein SAMN04488519_101363 [Algoriphagus ornithinivorans]